MNTSNFFPNATATPLRGRTSKPRRGFLGPEMPANQDVGDSKSTQDIWGDISMFQDDGPSWIVPPFLGRRVNSSRLPLPPFTRPPFVPAAQPREYADRPINPQGARDIEDSSDDEIVGPTTVHGGMDGPAFGSGPWFRSPSPRPDSRTASVPDSAFPRTQTPPMTPLGQPFLRPDPATNTAVHLADTCLRVVQVMYHHFYASKPWLKFIDRASEPWLECVDHADESSSALIAVFSALKRTLSHPPAHTRHWCAPLGLCAYEPWHARHERTLETLTEHLRCFLNDFDPPTTQTPKKFTARDFADTLAQYAKDFCALDRRMQRLWIRLAFDMNETAMRASETNIDASAAAVDAAAAAEREAAANLRRVEAELTGMRHDHKVLRRRRQSIRREFAAAPDKPQL